jgi:hypothetical protein
VCVVEREERFFFWFQGERKKNGEWREKGETTLFFAVDDERFCFFGIYLLGKILRKELLSHLRKGGEAAEWKPTKICLSIALRLAQGRGDGNSPEEWFFSGFFLCSEKEARTFFLR